jgi:hypothetical protein
MTAAGRAITAAESGNWHWQIRKHLHQLALVTSGKYPAADHKTLLGQLVEHASAMTCRAACDAKAAPSIRPDL